MNKNEKKNGSDTWMEKILNEVNFRESRSKEDRYDNPIPDEFGYLIRRSDNTAYGMAIRF